MSYTPQPGTLAFRVVRYFEDLPEGTEMASTLLSDAMETNPHGIRLQLSKAVESGFLAVRYGTHNSRQALIYSRGPEKMEVPDVSEEGDLKPHQRTVPMTSVPAHFAFAPQRDAGPFSVALTSDGRIVLERCGRIVCELNRFEAQIMVDWIDKNLERFIPKQAEATA